MLPLENFKVLDLSSYFPAPFSAMMLGDLGAEVIKIERTGNGDAQRILETATFISANQGKKSVTINLKEKAGRDILYSLASKSDVLIHNYLPSRAVKLGVNYEKIRAANPSIIYCSINGYGSSTGVGDKPLHNVNAMAAAGTLALSGELDGLPSEPGVWIADLAASMYAVVAILSALMLRYKTGVGRQIDVAMVDTTLACVSPSIIQYFLTKAGKEKKLFSYGGYGVFKAKDGYFTLAALENKKWSRLCELLGFREWLTDSIVNSIEWRKENCRLINKRINDVLATKEIEYWLELFYKNEITAEPVSEILDLVQNPYFLERGVIREMQVASQLNYYVPFPVKMNDVEFSRMCKVPNPGEHTEDILGSILTTDQIQKLKAKGVI